MTKYRVKPIEVEAEQQTNVGVCYTQASLRDICYGVPAVETFRKGDWVVTTPNGISRVWTEEEFAKNYESV
jgi:hypothetical protein